MEHGFPEFEYTPKLWGAIALMGLVAVAPMIGALVASNRRQTRRHVAFWFCFLLVAPLLFWNLPAQFAMNWRVEKFVNAIANVGLVTCFFASAFCVITVAVHSRKEGSKPILLRLCLGLAVAVGLFKYFYVPEQRRETPATLRCAINLHGLRNALDDSYPYPEAQSGSPPVSWRVQVAPYAHVGHWQDYDRTLPWDSEKNSEFAQRKTRAFMCPSRRQTQDSRGRYYADFAMLTGAHSFSRAVKRGYAEFRDGLSNKIAVIEAGGLNIVWTEPRDADIDLLPMGLNLKPNDKHESHGIGSGYHRGRVPVLMSGGRVHWLNEDIDPEVLRALTTVDGMD